MIQKQRQQQACDRAALSQLISNLTSPRLVLPDGPRTFSPLPPAILLRVCLTTASSPETAPTRTLPAFPVSLPP